MPTVKVDGCGSGVNNDISPEELGLGVWNTAENMRFATGYSARFGGMKQVFSTPSVTPYWIAPYQTATAKYIIHAGTNAVYSDDGTTRTNITGTAPTGGIDDRWTGGTVNGVFVMNNGVDVPTYWAGTGTLAALPGWTGTWKCKAMRPFKNFLIALNVSKGAVNYPYMVKWSTTLNPGSITAAGDWDETNPAKDAGEQDLAETPDVVVDCLPLGDVNVIYKERSMYAMTYVGAPYIFRFQRLPGESGLLAAGCVANTPLGHVVLAAGDVVLNTGSGVQSIANGIVRDYIFRNINSTYYKRSFVVSNPQKNEVWICFPYGDSQTCNKACVWNWIDKVWSFRSLPNVTYGCTGQVSLAATGTTWSGDSDSWSTDASSWNENELSPTDNRLILSHSTPYISLADVGTTDFGSLISASLERSGIDMGDPTQIKTVTRIRPVIDGSFGTTVNVQVGYSMFPDSAPAWGPVNTFAVGSDYKVDSIVTGRYIAIRFTNADYQRWRIKSFLVDYIVSGAY